MVINDAVLQSRSVQVLQLKIMCDADVHGSTSKSELLQNAYMTPPFWQMKPFEC